EQFLRHAHGTLQGRTSLEGNSGLTAKNYVNYATAPQEFQGQKNLGVRSAKHLESGCSSRGTLIRKEFSQ
ncbi:MAG: hypothetical protein ACLFVT_08190, partial [Syntrophobacteria bacterium]